MFSPRTRLRPLAALLAAIALLLGGLASVAPAAQAVGTASITGTVTSSEDAPIEGATAYLYVYNDEDEYFEFTGDYADTNASGVYSFTGLAAGDYRVQFWADLAATQYWNDAPVFDLADTVTLTAGQARAGIDATMEEGATLAGTISKQGGGTEADIRVDAVRIVLGEAQVIDSTYTDEDGLYSFYKSLPSGTYTLRLSYGDPVNYPSQYVGGTVSLASATSTTLTSGQEKTNFNG